MLRRMKQRQFGGSGLPSYSQPLTETGMVTLHAVKTETFLDLYPQDFI
jgi:hypothetical protein